MKKTILLLSLLASTVSFAEPPSAGNVFKSILKDSGLTALSQVTVEPRSANYETGTPETVLYRLRFTNGNKPYTCDASIDTSEIKAGEYNINAYIAECTGPAGSSVRLNNDYTDDRGTTVFNRVFYNNNTQFRPLNHEELAWREPAFRSPELPFIK